VNLAEFIGASLYRLGVRQGFGVVGSGNFQLTRSFADAGGTFVAARHEGGAATMADAYSRMSGEVALLSVHQGCGLTNALTGIAEAAKSRTPLIVAAPAAVNTWSNFYIDQHQLALSVQASTLTLDDPRRAVEILVEAVDRAKAQRQTVILNLPIDVLDAPHQDAGRLPELPSVERSASTEADLHNLAQELATAEKPVFIVGRGGRDARTELLELARHTGALLATSAVAAGLFAEDPWDLGISGGFSSPTAAQLISEADLIVAWGCALNMWTTRHGKLISPDTRVLQVDDTHEALGAHRDIHVGVHGDVQRTAVDVHDVLVKGGIAPKTGYRRKDIAEVIAKGRFTSMPYEDWGDSTTIDPRTLTRELDALLPRPRVVSVDSGNFMGYPSTYFTHDDVNSLCFTQAFQSIGLGLATAIGAGLAHRDRWCVAALGDGGAAMGIAELETVARLELPMCIVIYNDCAYSAEVHHFDGANHDQVIFDDVDFAAIARGFGLQGVSVRTPADLEPVKQWVANPTTGIVIDAKVASSHPAWWLSQAFGH